MSAMQLRIRVLLLVAVFAQRRDGNWAAAMQSGQQSETLVVTASTEPVVKVNVSEPPSLVAADASVGAQSSSRRRRRTEAMIPVSYSEAAKKENCISEPCLPYQDIANIADIQDGTHRARVGTTHQVPQDGDQPMFSGDASEMLPLELHLRGIRLEKLLSAYNSGGLAGMVLFESKGLGLRSVADLLELLKAELCKAANVAPYRLVITSIHGKFASRVEPTATLIRSSRLSELLNQDELPTQMPLPNLTNSVERVTDLHEEDLLQKDENQSRPSKKSSGSFSLVQHKIPIQGRLDEQVVVRFYIGSASLPGDVSQDQVFNILDRDLRNPLSVLRTGPLSKLLEHATVQVGSDALYEMTDAQDDRLSQLALPAGISAAFTGILIWLASW